MSLTNSTPVSIVKTTITEFSEDRCMQMAAALAYYTMFAVAPLMVVVIAVAGFFLQQSGVAGSEAEVESTVVSEIGHVVGEQPAQQISEMLSSSQRGGGSTWTTILSTVMLLFGATAIVAQLQASMNQAWEVEPDPNQGGFWNFAKKRILSLGMIIGIAFLLLVSLVLSTVLEAFNNLVMQYLPEGIGSWVPKLTNFVLQLLITTGLFAAIFKVLPDAKIRWRDVGIGAFVTALAFSLGRYAISLYLAQGNVSDGFGLAGSLVVFLVWVYYSSVIFFIGVEFTQVYIRSRGRRIEPVEGAVRVVRKVEKQQPAAA
ncbi:YihY/virulence factor BrkB family protein [Candidatus Laterigemmans baculatus]|uniref:YihY/virulence factor BrkB family protein n=1 Tax=Candidatus Laterigemmans baculatus TaxID=2770505 RepID=UPI0013D9AA0C|nr:YihY/virulence factor BrkB family protein [Candidatus Laterigemmans baculatus]